MRKIKKMLALVIAAVMIVGTMGMTVMADTAGDLTPDATITISGLDSGDTVHLYQILQWDENDGWELVHAAGEASPLAALTTTGDANFSQKVKDLVDNVPNTTLGKEDLEKIANVVKASGTDLSNSEINSDTFTYTTSSAPGMYIALVTPGEAGVIYNPIVVSSDFTGNNTTSEINASTALMGSSSVAKKEKITVTKEAEEQNDATSNDNAHDVGDIVKFTVTTKIPAYSNSYVDPQFKVTDSLSKGLTMVVDGNHPFTVTSTVAGKNTNVEPATGDTSWTYEFDSDAIAALEDYADVTITYYAEIGGEVDKNVNEKENTVTVEFSNNPNNDQSKGTLKDKTKHYTFTIDGKLLGEETYKNSELVKVGVDQQGNPIESVISESNARQLLQEQFSNSTKHRQELRQRMMAIFTRTMCLMVR